MIDANPYLAPIQKMQYLFSYVQGDARETIDHIVPTNDNYFIALDILRRRYNNEKKICDEYVGKILDLPRMESRFAAGILNIYNVLTMSLHGLRRCNFQTNSWAPMVVSCVTRKLDEESRQKFEEALMDSRKVPSITQLLDFLDRRYQVLLTDAHSRSTNKKTCCRDFRHCHRREAACPYYKGQAEAEVCAVSFGGAFHSRVHFIPE